MTKNSFVAEATFKQTRRLFKRNKVYLYELNILNIFKMNLAPNVFLNAFYKLSHSYMTSSSSVWVKTHQNST